MYIIYLGTEYSYYHNVFVWQCKSQCVNIGGKINSGGTKKKIKKFKFKNICSHQENNNKKGVVAVLFEYIKTLFWVTFKTNMLCCVTFLTNMLWSF